MTDTRTFRLVKITGWSKEERANLAGRLVELVGDGRVDHRGARAYRMDEGPMEGQEVWFTDAELDKWPRDIPTKGDA